MVGSGDLVERVRTATSESLRGIIVYDEHVHEVLYPADDAALPLGGLDGPGLERDLVGKHLAPEPLLEDPDRLPHSYTYHTEAFLAVQFPLLTYRGVFVVFDSDADPSLQRLHEQVREWQREGRPSTKDRSGLLGLSSLVSFSARSPAAVLANCCCGVIQCSQACGCCLPI
jgi:hypothetical protein